MADEEPFHSSFKVATVLSLDSLFTSVFIQGHLKREVMCTIQELEIKKELAKEFYECANDREEVKSFRWRNYSAVSLKETITSDTLCDEDHPVELYRINFLNQLFSWVELKQKLTRRNRYGFNRLARRSNI